MFRKHRSLASSLLVLSLLSASGVALADQEPQEIPYEVMPAVAGEVCTVCGVPVTGEDIALIVRGRRVPLKREMLDQFLAKPEEYFATLQPRGALFQENSPDPQGGSMETGVDFFWFAAGLYLLVALMFAGLSGYTAVSKGLDPIRHFFIGLLFSAPGYLYVLTRPPVAGPVEVPRGWAKVATTRSPVKCEKCGALNHPSSGRCSDCGATLVPQTVSEVKKQ
ncbi:MAG: hypothetical protein OEV30_01960 [Ignavibacteria bacterium]|nr:hypothetical protein [Ignavibacteria bacterium]